MTSLIILCTLRAAQIILPSEAFASSSLGGLALCSKTTTRSIIGFPTSFAAASSDNEADDSTDKTPPSPPATPTVHEFTADEVQEMENLVRDLSKEQNDDLRRQKLADILDKELVAAVDNDNSDSSDSSEVTLPQEIPRFAQLFQYSLDIVGESVQAAAREKAMELNENSLNVIEGSSSGENVPGTGSDRVKSDEEMQLWALIDMMVQSKTRVKLYMGSLGSKGAFR
eukprot:CAMPEP_0113374088 /NCGR_PEP_ID=MMETSP0013_2-20120614/1397_1 /TAXON_ID=2843 ORGANISM="Skeletonema costatum, Strain 1716" /NCGR_SAMPLE_ID=MMETSP0013_2 /ASSEMBLY_ACC=CAM_ASM_000158 /LENGTH=226 /DNA_ID=CAMNT_0000256055 /DNA_START=54 /DNA_END=734 /DNA_ORIENTATION=+ /assembly_acc=CAM_ASM_000158